MDGNLPNHGDNNMDVKDERFDKLIEEGHAATWDQDWDLAIDCYKKH